MPKPPTYQTQLPVIIFVKLFLPSVLFTLLLLWAGWDPAYTLFIPFLFFMAFTVYFLFPEMAETSRVMVYPSRIIIKKIFTGEKNILKYSEISGSVFSIKVGAGLFAYNQVLVFHNKKNELTQIDVEMRKKKLNVLTDKINRQIANYHLEKLVLQGKEYLENFNTMNIIEATGGYRIFAGEPEQCNDIPEEVENLKISDKELKSFINDNPFLFLKIVFLTRLKIIIQNIIIFFKLNITNIFPRLKREVRVDGNKLRNPA